MDPFRGLYCPGGHAEHVVEASKAEKNPALHAVHCEVSLAEKVPGKHPLHVPLTVKKPAGHCMQSVALDDPVVLWE